MLKKTARRRFHSFPAAELVIHARLAMVTMRTERTAMLLRALRPVACCRVCLPAGPAASDSACVPFQRKRCWPLQSLPDNHQVFPRQFAVAPSTTHKICGQRLRESGVWAIHKCGTSQTLWPTNDSTHHPARIPTASCFDLATRSGSARRSMAQTVRVTTSKGSAVSTAPSPADTQPSVVATRSELPSAQQDLFGSQANSFDTRPASE